MRKTLFAILLALALVMIPAGNAFALSTDVVDVTATPAILSISNAPPDWGVNCIVTPASLVNKSTTYFAHAGTTWVDDIDWGGDNASIDDNDCRFTFTNDGDVNADITISMTGLGTMLNGEGGYSLSDVDEFGASFYLSGGTWPGGAPEILLTTPTAFETDFAPGAIKWGVALLTQTNSFTVDAPLTGTINLIAEES